MYGSLSNLCPYLRSCSVFHIPSAVYSCEMLCMVYHEPLPVASHLLRLLVYCCGVLLAVYCYVLFVSCVFADRGAWRTHQHAIRYEVVVQSLQVTQQTRS